MKRCQQESNFINDCSVVIFCGGQATRLRSVLSHTPKALVKLDRKPYLYGLLQQIKQSGIKNVVLCISLFTSKIVNEIHDGYSLGLNIRYSYDSGLFENSDALFRAINHITTPRIICVNGDTIVNINLPRILNFHSRVNKIGTLVASNRLDQPHPAAIEVKGERVVDLHEGFQDMGQSFPFEKYSNGYSNSGVYVFDVNQLKNCWLNQYKKGKLEQGLLRYLAKANQLSAFDNGNNYLIDLGTPERLKTARNSLQFISMFFNV